MDQHHHICYNRKALPASSSSALVIRQKQKLQKQNAGSSTASPRGSSKVTVILQTVLQLLKSSDCGCSDSTRALHSQSHFLFQQVSPDTMVVIINRVCAQNSI